MVVAAEATEESKEMNQDDSREGAAQEPAVTRLFEARAAVAPSSAVQARLSRAHSWEPAGRSTAAALQKAARLLSPSPPMSLSTSRVPEQLGSRSTGPGDLIEQGKRDCHRTPASPCAPSAPGAPSSKFKRRRSTASSRAGGGHSQGVDGPDQRAAPAGLEDGQVANLLFLRSSSGE